MKNIWTHGFTLSRKSEPMSSELEIVLLVAKWQLSLCEFSIISLSWTFFSAINSKVFLPEGLRGTDRKLSGLSGVGGAERLVAASWWSNLHPASTSARHHLKAEVQDSQGVMTSHIITLCWTVTEIPSNVTDFIFLDDVHTIWDNNN